MIPSLLLAAGDIETVFTPLSTNKRTQLPDLGKKCFFSLHLGSKKLLPTINKKYV